MQETIIISELCGQFGGSVRKAEQMMLQSKMAGADMVKVQLYDTYRMPGENRELWKYLSISEGELKQIDAFAKRLNMTLFASVFHEDKFQLSKTYGFPIIKIASSLLVSDFELCQKIVDYGKTVFCSLGKWELKKRDNIFPFSDDNVVYFHCVCEYPHYFKRAMELMPDKFTGKLLGYSDHCVGIEACKEAVKRGALYIEKHFTTDHLLQCKTEGAHQCSMDYQELTLLRNFCDEYARGK